MYLGSFLVRSAEVSQIDVAGGVELVGRAEGGYHRRVGGEAVGMSGRKKTLENGCAMLGRETS